MFLDRFGDPLDLVRLQIVHDQNVAGAEVRGDLLADVFREQGTVDRAVHDQGGEESVESQRGDERGGFPMPVRHGVDDPFARGPPSVEAGHGGGAGGFIEENKAGRVDRGRDDFPVRAGGGDIGPLLLGGVDGLFLG